MRIDFARDQPLANEYFACFNRIDGTVVDSPSPGENEPVKGDLFKGDDLTAFALPVWLEIGARDEVRADLFDPFRFNRRHGAGIDARGFGELKRHHPFHTGGFLCSVLLALAGQLEFDGAGAKIVIAL